ncbi:RNA polymerase [Dysgonomonas sp. 25]|uniref:RNA polymerase n=1 Tax=Dysgonomonas sp. 25 TaxID=2302933 RepID=UPI0013D4F60C|nr:RNA polymerase [Dysgonomonas sp. 25]NDV69974.1 RNA polymerase [Dysgonomonas sp. 25]
MVKQTIYRQNGFEDRNDYLQSLADDYGVNVYVIFSLAEIIGESEDFDELISTLEILPI